MLKKRALETASVSRNEKHQPTVVSSADGAKVLKNVETLARELGKSSTQPKTFIGRLYCAVEIDGKTYRVKTTMQEFRDSEEISAARSSHSTIRTLFVLEE